MKKTMTICAALAAAGGILAAEREFNVRDCGARQDATVAENTSAFQKALDMASKEDGRVIVPPGTWTCGTLYLRSSCELHLEEGAVLKASPNLDDYNPPDAYPENWPCPPEGWNAHHFLIGNRVERCSITGPGVVDGNADAFFEKESHKEDWCKIVWAEGVRRQKDKVRLRPGQLIVFIKSKDVGIGDLTVRNATCWSLFFHGCDGVAVSDYTVRNGHCDLNTDGIDIDCCSNVSLVRADIDTGDDAIAIRASQRHLGIEKPCEHIRIADCRLSAYAMGIRIGVGNGLIRDVDISNCTVRHGAWGVSFDCWYGRKENAGVDVEDVRIRNCTFDDCYENWRIRIGGDRQEFGVRNILFKDCRFLAPKPGMVEYAGPKTVTNFRMEGCEWSPRPNSSFDHLLRTGSSVIQ